MLIDIDSLNKMLADLENTSSRYKILTDGLNEILIEFERIDLKQTDEFLLAAAKYREICGRFNRGVCGLYPVTFDFDETIEKLREFITENALDAKKSDPVGQYSTMIEGQKAAMIHMRAYIEDYMKFLDIQADPVKALKASRIMDKSK